MLVLCVLYSRHIEQLNFMFFPTDCRWQVSKTGLGRWIWQDFLFLSPGWCVADYNQPCVCVWVCVWQHSSDHWFRPVSLACTYSHWWYFMKKRFSARSSSRLNKSAWACYSYLMPLKPAGNLSQLSSLNASHSLRPYCKESGNEERKRWRNRELRGLLRQLSSISTVSHSLWDVRVRETSTQAHCWPLYSMCMLGHTVRLRALHGQLDKGGRMCLAIMDGVL